MKYIKPHNILISLTAIAAILLWFLEGNVNDYILTIIQFAGINIILATSLNFTNGFTGLFFCRSSGLHGNWWIYNCLAYLSCK